MGRDTGRVAGAGALDIRVVHYARQRPFGHQDFGGMNSCRTVRQKLVEWMRRYLPCELAGWAGELGGAAATYWLTGSLALAVIVGTIGSSVGYYATAYINGVRWAYRAQTDLRWPMRVLDANFRALRSIAIEFGPAEAIDSIVIRPLALYAGPFVFGNVAVGWVVGSVAADIAFYVLAIFSYERFTGLLVRPQRKEVDGELVPVAGP